MSERSQFDNEPSHSDPEAAGVGSGEGSAERSGVIPKVIAGIAIAAAVVAGLILQTAFFYVLVVAIPVVIAVLVYYIYMARHKRFSTGGEPRVSTILRKTR